VNALLEELQCLVEDAYYTALTANLSAINVPDESTADNKLSHEYDFTEVGLCHVFVLPMLITAF
jgi:hypothetical protein